MLKNILASIAFGMMCTATAMAFTGGNGCLYPGFSEFDPSPPYSSDSYSYEKYRQEVEEYVEHAKEYVENANDDISDIQNKQQEAIRKANDVVDEFNSWVRRH